jgi:hypothetical protein
MSSQGSRLVYVKSPHRLVGPGFRKLSLYAHALPSAGFTLFWNILKSRMVPGASPDKRPNAPSWTAVVLLARFKPIATCP